MRMSHHDRIEVPDVRTAACSSLAAALARGALALALSGCATAPARPTGAAPPRTAPHRSPPPRRAATTPATTAAAPAPPARRPARPRQPAPRRRAAAVAPGQPQPFADVIKDAKETPGLFSIWQKDDKVWIEIAPEQFDMPYFFRPTCASGIGETAGVYGGHDARRTAIVDVQAHRQHTSS